MHRHTLVIASVAALAACSPPLSPGDSDEAGVEEGGVDAGPDVAADAGADADVAADGRADAEVEEPRECLEEEECLDGLDNDCDGVVDEGCFCDIGMVMPCFRGDPRTRGRGACRDGEMECGGPVEFPEWGPCEGDVLATSEVCDADGVDEDCDGAPNDGCDCIEGDPDVSCGTDVGACVTGIQRCVGGRWTECEGGVGPQPEECNDIDDDCDGRVDDDVARSCGSSVGACRPGTEACSEGEWGPCVGGNPESDEVCDGLDNDCDGETDEEVTRICGSSVGRCVEGVETCSDGLFGPCEGAIGPVGESCNGVDDDCDGETDEELSLPCGIDTGRCVAGVERCEDGAWGDCEGALWPSSELCDGEEDEDCDGEVDEGCDCVLGESRPCGTDVGLCNSGLELCDELGSWGACEGSIDPVDEECNGEDDDCDGETDEGDVCPRFPPVATCPGDASTTVGSAVELAGSGSDPDGGEVTYEWTVSDAPVGSAADPVPSDSADTGFSPDVAGEYQLSLCVTDDEAETTCCTATVTALPPCVPPSPPALTSCAVSWDRRPVVEFDPVPAGVIYELYVDTDPLPYATVTLEGQNYHRPSIELGEGGPPPDGTTIDITGRACLAADPGCCADGAPVTVALIEECTTAVAPTSSNVVFSEYVTNGDGSCSDVATCEAGEAIEITNLSHCPVTLEGQHFGYCNPPCTTFRWMNFGPTDIIPPRGVYVAIRNRDASSCPYPFFGADDPGLFGLRISTLDMEGPGLSSGWFNNDGEGDSVLRIATGEWVSITGGTTIAEISPYSGSAGECESIGFDAVDDCGTIASGETPTEVLAPNQLGRLWHPCDAVVAPVPDTCM